MLSTVFGAGIFGIEGYSVTVECNANDRLPAFNIVGLPDAAIKESKERIKAAVINSGFFFPDAEITRQDGVWFCSLSVAEERVCSK